MNGLKNKSQRKQLLNFEIKIVLYYVRCLKAIYKRHIYKKCEINCLSLRDIFNTMSLQEAGDHDSPQVPGFYYLQCILRKDSGVVFHVFSRVWNSVFSYSQIGFHQMLVSPVDLLLFNL